MEDTQTRYLANRLERRSGIAMEHSMAIAEDLVLAGFIITADIARLIAGRIQQGLCVLRAGWCLTHDVADDMEHHFNQPGTGGHSRFGIAKND